MQKINPKLKDVKYVYFYFETTQNTGEHIVNFSVGKIITNESESLVCFNDYGGYFLYFNKELEKNTSDNFINLSEYKTSNFNICNCINGSNRSNAQLMF